MKGLRLAAPGIRCDGIFRALCRTAEHHSDDLKWERYAGPFRSVEDGLSYVRQRYGDLLPPAMVVAGPAADLGPGPSAGSLYREAQNGGVDKSAKRELKRLLERARNPGSVPRKQHLVPGSYLDRWAVNGQIRVTEVDTGTTYCVSPKKAARKTDYYNLSAPGINPEELPPLLFEVVLSEVESWGKQAIDALLHARPRDIDPELMAQFAFYLALQMTRGDRFRSQLRDSSQQMAVLQFGDMTDAGITQTLRKRGKPVTDEEVASARWALDQLKDGDLRVVPPDALMTGIAGQIAYSLGENLLSREWVVWQSPPILLTSDEPVVIIGGPGATREEIGGLEGAAVVAFPLAPDAVLVMTPHQLPQGRLEHIEVAELNREIAASATRWVFERGDRRTSTAIAVPPLPTPSTLTEELLTADPTRRLVRHYRPSRWSGHLDLPNWPVARWYR